MFYVFALAVLAASVSSNPTEGPYPLLLLSFDGVSAEVAKGLSSLTEFKKAAASVSYLKSVFPTKTFSTHFSVSTGVTPGVHGVIGNTQYDKHDNKVRNHPHQFRHVEDINPIWVENEKASKERNSGTMMWPGAQFSYLGKYKDPSKEFENNFEDDGNDEPEEEDGSQNDDDNYEGGTKADYRVDYKPADLTWDKRADKIIEWLTDKKCNLVMAYFEDYGSLDENKKEEVKKDHITKVDGIIKNIYAKIKAAGLEEKINIIIMSDHGTGPTTGKDIIMIDEILDIKDEPKNILSSGPLAYISPEQDQIDLAYDQLKKKSEGGNLYNVYKKSELKWDKMKELDIILDQHITVVANPPYTFYTQPYLNFIKEKYGLKKENIVQDVNGYDNELPIMNGFFYGIGPSFLDNKHLDDEGFVLDEVYPLIKKLIGLPLQDSSSVQKNNDLDPTVVKLLEESALK